MPLAEAPTTPVSLYPYTSSPLSQAVITFNAAAENAAIAAVAAQITRVYMLWIIPSAAVTLTIKRGSTALTGPMVVTTQGLFLPFCGVPYFVTAANEAFVLSTTAIQISGAVWFLTS